MRKTKGRRVQNANNSTCGFQEQATVMYFQKLAKSTYYYCKGFPTKHTICRPQSTSNLVMMQKVYIIKIYHVLLIQWCRQDQGTHLSCHGGLGNDPVKSQVETDMNKAAA